LEIGAPQTKSVIYQSQKYKSRQNGDVRMTRNTTKKDATHLFHQCEKLQLEDTNKYVLVFSVKAKHGL
jgi:hypothetical protein